MMRKVLQAVVLRGAVQRKEAQPIRDEIIQIAMAKQDMVCGLVRQTGELMLAGTVFDPKTRQDSLSRIAEAWAR